MSGNFLVVEDSQCLRTSVKKILIDVGFSVTTATNGVEALGLVRGTRFDLIVLDMLLPRLGGEQVLRALKQDPATASIPVLVLSSLPQCNAEKLKEAGAIAYVEKSKLDLADGGTNFVRLVNAALHTAKEKINGRADAKNLAGDPGSKHAFASHQLS